MNANFLLKIKIKPDFTSAKEILEDTFDATLSLSKNKISINIQLEKPKRIFDTIIGYAKSFGKIFFEVVSVTAESNFFTVKNIFLNEENIKNHSSTETGDSIEMDFSSIEFEIEDDDSQEDDIFCMYYNNLPSYRDFYNLYTINLNTFKPTFELTRKRDSYQKLTPDISIRPEMEAHVKDNVQETIFKKNSFININSTLNADDTIQCVYTLDLIFSFYYRKKIKCNYIKYLVNKKGKIVYSISDNSELERFATFHLGMQNKFVLLYNINFETVLKKRSAFSDIVNSYIIAAQSEDIKSRFILYYSVLELLKANFAPNNQINFSFEKLNIKESIKVYLESISKFLIVKDDNNGSKLQAEKEMLTGQFKIDNLSNAVTYKPLKFQFDPLMERYPLNLKKYGIDLRKIVKLRGKLFHGGSLEKEDEEYLKKICTRDYFPKFITELIATVMGADPENYNRNIFEV